MQFKNILTLSGAGLFLLLIIGCAKTNVHETFSVASTGMSKPNSVMIYIFPISPEDYFRKSNFRKSSSDGYIVDPSTIYADIQRSIKADPTPTVKEIQLQLDHREREVSDAMATELTQKITALGLNAIRADQNSQVTPESIMVTVNFIIFDKVNESSKSRNGQSWLESKVSVLASTPLGNKQLFSFDVNADISRAGGSYATWMIGSSGAGDAATIETNVAASAQQAKKMADEISVQLASYFAKQDWINPNLVQ